MANAQCSMPNASYHFSSGRSWLSFRSHRALRGRSPGLLESSGFRNQLSLINQISRSIKSDESKTKILGNTNESFTETKNISVQDKTLDDVELQRTFWNWFWIPGGLSFRFIPNAAIIPTPSIIQTFPTEIYHHILPKKKRKWIKKIKWDLI